MKCFKKFCVQVGVSNASKEKYLDYDTSINGGLIGNRCLRFHDSEELNSFEKNNGEYTEVYLPGRIVLKENAKKF